MLGQRQRIATKKQILPGIVAFLFSIGAAVSAVALFGRYELKFYVPLVFILVAILAATFWGASGSILGLLASAALFALFLFTPIGSLRVQADVARANLAWMLLLGLPAAYLFAKPPEPKNPLPKK